MSDRGRARLLPRAGAGRCASRSKNSADRRCSTPAVQPEPTISRQMRVASLVCASGSGIVALETPVAHELLGVVCFCRPGQMTAAKRIQPIQMRRILPRRAPHEQAVHVMAATSCAEMSARSGS
jgi:hypothetical protein